MYQKIILIGACAWTVLAATPTTGSAACAEKLDALDQRARSTPPDARVEALFGQVRERAVDLCKAGQEAAAGQTVQMLEGLLPAPTTQSPTEPAKPIGSTLNDTDYTRAVQSFEHDSPNPWDRLTNTQICDWLTADEIEAGLGLAVELSISRSDWLCNYRFMMPNDRSATAFTLYVEPHEDPNYPRNAEFRVGQGPGALQNVQFDPGSRLLHAFNNEYAPTIHVFPKDGVTIWLLTFLADSPEKDVMFGSSPQPANLGKAFLKLLIDKYGERFDSDP